MWYTCFKWEASPANYIYIKRRMAGVKIDNNEMMLRSMALEKAGQVEEGHRLRDEFVALLEGQEHCTCREQCIYHGKCRECVAIHRGHRDHFPACIQPMVEELSKGTATGGTAPDPANF